MKGVVSSQPSKAIILDDVFAIFLIPDRQVFTTADWLTNNFIRWSTDLYSLICYNQQNIYLEEKP
jgi:hypothetical protein